MKGVFRRFGKGRSRWTPAIFTSLLAFSIMAFQPPTTSWAKPRIGLNTGTDAPYTTPDRKGFLDLIVADLFQELGYQGEINRYVGASARALQNSNSGHDDGEALRIGGLEKRFANLLPIPESILDNDFVAYSLAGKDPIKTWEDLTPHMVSYLIGWQIFAKNINPGQNVVTVRGAGQLFELLKLNRVDYSLYERWQGLYQARKSQISVIVHEPPLASVKMFMYLHKKHAALVSKAARLLSQMKKDGRYQRIIDQTLTPLARN